MIQSDKERYRKEIIHTLFTAVFYLITELNQREQSSEQKQGRCEVLFDQFMQLLGEYNKRERNVSFYARQLNITPKYLSSVVKEDERQDGGQVDRLNRSSSKRSRC